MKLIHFYRKDKALQLANTMLITMLLHYNRLNSLDIHHNDTFNVFGKKRLIQNDALSML